MIKDLGVSSLFKRYRPSLFVLASQVVAATLNAAAKFIETKSNPVHPFTILHIRMLITGLGCSFCLWRNGSSKSENFFGTPDVRGLILLRALGGVCGATGFFFSIIYLNLSEATALNFLGPLGSLILTRYLSFATVQWTDCVGAMGALIGVVLIAQPEDLFGPTATRCKLSGEVQDHLKGLAFSVLGFCGGVITITSIRRIGTRAHPLTSVNVFAWSLVVVSGIGFLVIPGEIWPSNPLTWAFLIFIGTCGFVMEYLLTFGISNDSSSAATLMIYSQIVWALAIDRVLFQVTANSWALFGAATIISSLFLVTITKDGRIFGGVTYTNLNGEEDECTESFSLDEVNAGQISP